MNIKYWILVGLLGLGIVFLIMDKCSSPTEIDNLKREYKEAKEIAEVEKRIKEETIKEQHVKIRALNTKIEARNTTIVKQGKELDKTKEELGELKRDFVSLEECQAQYNKLVEGFNLAEGIIKELGKPIEYYDEHGNKKFRYPEGTVTFNLNEKYEKQVIVSLGWKELYESEYDLRLDGEKIVRSQNWQIKKLTITSRVKTGIVLVISGVVLYSLLRK